MIYMLMKPININGKKKKVLDKTFDTGIKEYDLSSELKSFSPGVYVIGSKL